eukprot:2072286-Rhodomonas_salina.1
MTFPPRLLLASPLYPPLIHKRLSSSREVASPQFFHHRVPMITSPLQCSTVSYVVPAQTEP